MFTRRLKSSRRVESTSTSRGKLTGGADGFPRPPRSPAPDWLHAGTVLRIGGVVRIQSPVQGNLKRKKKLNKNYNTMSNVQGCQMDTKSNSFSQKRARARWPITRQEEKNPRKKCQEKQQMAPNEKESCWECFFI